MSRMPPLILSATFLLFCPFAPSAHEGSPRQDVVVYLTEQPDALTARQIQSNQPGPDARILEFCKRKKLQCKLVLVDWLTGFNRVQHTPNSLFVAADRIPEREERFHWVLPIEPTDYFLYGLANKGLERLSPGDLAKGNYTAACARHSTQCQLLRDLGFTEDRIIAENEYTPEQRYRGLLNDRFHFTVLSPDNLKHLNLDATAIVPTLKLATPSSYVVAGLQTDPWLLEHLMSEPIE